MLDATRRVKGKIVRILVVQPDDCWKGFPFKRIQEAMHGASISRHPYHSIEMPKMASYLGVKVIQYVKPKKNLASIDMGLE